MITNIYHYITDFISSALSCDTKKLQDELEAEYKQELEQAWREELKQQGIISDEH